jgi:hypothetical protein
MEKKYLRKSTEKKSLFNTITTRILSILNKKKKEK